MDNWNLEELQADTDAALKLAFEHRYEIDDPVNWGDLRCVSAESYRATGPDEGLRVWIEEAAPGCWKLAEFVNAALRLRGWPHVEVLTGMVKRVRGPGEIFAKIGREQLIFSVGFVAGMAAGYALVLVK